MTGALLERVNSGDFLDQDRLYFSVSVASKILLLSGLRRLYLRHVEIKYGVIADITCATTALLLVCIPLRALTSVQYVAILVALVVILCLLRSFVLPRSLTPEGVEEVITSMVVEKKVEALGESEDEKERFILSRETSAKGTTRIIIGKKDDT